MKLTLTIFTLGALLATGILCSGFTSGSHSEFNYAVISLNGAEIKTIRVAEVRYESCNCIRVRTLDGEFYETSSNNILLKSSL